MCKFIGFCQFHENVANYDRWPICRGGQLHTFYCIKMDLGVGGNGLDSSGLE
jgi:hypothetical protein